MSKKNAVPKVNGIRQIADELSKKMKCNCDLDNWQPTELTGHTAVCRIHKMALSRR